VDFEKNAEACVWLDNKHLRGIGNEGCSIADAKGLRGCIIFEQIAEDGS